MTITKTIEQRVRRASETRREGERDSARGKILEAAAALLLAEGYDAFSMRRVGEGAGYTATTIYRYFKDKDELVFTVTDEAFVEFGRRLEAAAAAESDPMQRLTALGKAYVKFGLERPVHYRLMFVQRPDFLLACSPGSDDVRISGFNSLRDAVAAVIATGKATSNQTELTSHTLWAGVHGIVCLALSMDWIDADIVDAMLDQQMAFVRAGLMK